jgi:hypothetical protein
MHSPFLPVKYAPAAGSLAMSSACCAQPETLAGAQRLHLLFKKWLI